MNIHPIFVHFPIAFLTVYAVMELAYTKKLNALPYWFYIKATLVIVGALGAFATLQTGEIAAESFRSPSAMSLIRIHSNWATGATVIFAVLAAAYLIAWINRTTFVHQINKTTKLQKIWGILTSIQTILIQTPLAPLLAVAGLIAITVTGSLGGAIVYGPNADPFVSFVYRLLVK